MAASSLGILLDLDDTLVLTSELEPLRRGRRWSEVYAAFAKTSLPPGTHRFAAWLAELGRAGIVTSAPRRYAELLLAHHRLALPVLVAYHDTVRHKPHPEPLLEAARRLAWPASGCVHVGDTATDDAAAAAAGMRSIRVGWGAEGDSAVRDWDDVLARLAPLGAPVIARAGGKGAGS